MQEFDVPILDAMSSPLDAFPRMLECSRSGIAIKVGAEMRLLPFDLLVEAVDRGTTKLRDIDRFESVTILERDLHREAYSTTLETAGEKYGVIEVGPTVRVVSRSERFAGIYMTSPPVTKCRNPNTPHYYPPNQRDPRNWNRCRLCPFELP